MVFETTVCIALSVHGIQSFALYLSASNDVAAVTQRMWKVSFCRENDVSFPVGLHFTGHWLDLHLLWTQLPTCGCFTASPRWYLYQALDSNLCWMLPWAIVVTVLSLPSSLAWTYYAVIFGGALVFDLLDVGLTLLIWIHRLSRGKLRSRSHIEYHWPRTDMRSRVGSRHQKYLWERTLYENGKQYDLSM